jgi:hypothetical protein
VILLPSGLGLYGSPASAIERDQYFDEVELLLHMDGVNGSTTFTDVTGKSISNTNNPSISTAQHKFGGASGSFGGTANVAPSTGTDQFFFNYDDFTIEFWVRFSTDTRQYIYDAGTNNYSAIIITPSNGLVEIYGPASHVITAGTVPFSINTWYHIALTRDSGTWRFFRDGSLYQSVTDGRSWGSDALTVRVGGSGVANCLNGYLDDFRITKYLARYTSAFTPPTSPHPDTGPLQTFAKWNPADRDADVMLGAGLLRMTGRANNFSSIRADVGKSSGKHYWETVEGGNLDYAYSGIATAAATMTNQWIGAEATSISGVFNADSGLGNCYRSGAIVATYTGLSAFDSYRTVRHKLDMDAGTYEVAVNGGSFLTIQSGLTGTWYPAATHRTGNGEPWHCTANFGATPFTYSVPSGYRAGMYA